MKNLVNKKMLLSIIAVFGLFLTSCDKDDDSITPTPLASDVKGEYSGKINATVGTTKKEHAATFTVRDTLVVFDNFPLTELVSAVVKDGPKAEAAVKALGSVKYNLKYTGKVNAAKNGVDLTFAQKPLEIEIPIDAVKKKATITFKTTNSGIYTSKNKTIKFVLEAEKIVVDGAQITPFTTITYEIPSLVKK
jgi:hypothetical protein